MAEFDDKNKIERQQLKNHLLKRVIVRFDYTSIVDIQGALKKIVEYLAPPDNYFRSLNQMQLAITGKDPLGTKDGSNPAPPPMVYRFSDCLLEPKQDVAMDFSQDNLCLEIHCNENYSLIDKYLDMMSSLMGLILAHEKFVQLKRIGIRKINGVDAIDGKDADKVFEYFTQQLPWGSRDKTIMRQYTDYVTCHDIPATVIYNRIVRGIEASDDLRFTLDIDCFKDSIFLESRPTDGMINSWLVAMNKKMFDLFKMGIKLEYFNRNL